ncbi:MAG: hypothetical protein PHW10_02605 [Candidatus Peribacteraceae bacterium]|nr:hypothetical protein [Candidatus Peribacteraceae bacterium]
MNKFALLIVAIAVAFAAPAEAGWFFGFKWHTSGEVQFGQTDPEVNVVAAVPVPEQQHVPSSGYSYDNPSPAAIEAYQRAASRNYQPAVYYTGQPVQYSEPVYTGQPVQYSEPVYTGQPVQYQPMYHPAANQTWNYEQSQNYWGTHGFNRLPGR